jgi:hypothetical protein
VLFLRARVLPLPRQQRRRAAASVVLEDSHGPIQAHPHLPRIKIADHRTGYKAHTTSMPS